MASRRRSWPLVAALMAVLVVGFADVAAEAADGGDSWFDWARDIIGMKGDEGGIIIEQTNKASIKAQDMASGTGQYASEKGNNVKETVAGKASDAAEKAREYKNTAAEKGEQIKNAASRKAEDWKQTASEKTQAAGDTASRSSDAAKDTAARSSDASKEAAARSSESAKETAARGSDAAKETAARSSEAAEDTAETAKGKVGAGFGAAKHKSQVATDNMGALRGRGEEL